MKSYPFKAHPNFPSIDLTILSIFSKQVMTVQLLRKTSCLRLYSLHYHLILNCLSLADGLRLVFSREVIWLKIIETDCSTCEDKSNLLGGYQGSQKVKGRAQDMGTVLISCRYNCAA